MISNAQFLNCENVLDIQNLLNSGYPNASNYCTAMRKLGQLAMRTDASLLLKAVSPCLECLTQEKELRREQVFSSLTGFGNIHLKLVGSGGQYLDLKHEFVSKCVKEIKRIGLSLFDAHEVCALVLAFTKLIKSSYDEYDDILSVMLKQVRKSNKYMSNDHVRIAYSLVKLQLRLGYNWPPFMPYMYEVYLVKVVNLQKAQDLANSIYLLAKMRTFLDRSSKEQEQYRKQVLPSVFQQIASYRKLFKKNEIDDKNGVASVMYSLADFQNGFYESSLCFDENHFEIGKTFRLILSDLSYFVNFQPLALSNILWGLVKARFVDYNFLKKTVDLFTGADLNPQMLASIIISYGRAGYTGNVDQLASSALKSISNYLKGSGPSQNWGLQEIANVLWGLAVMSAAANSSSHVSSLKKILQLVKDMDFEQSQQTQLHQVYLFVKIHTEIEEISVWKTAISEQTEQNHETQTENKRAGFHLEVAEILQETLPSCKLKHEVWVADHLIDIQVKTPTRKVLVEVDGPYHFLQDIRTNELVRTGATKLKHYVVKHTSGLSLLHVSDSDFLASKVSKKRKKTVRKLIEKHFQKELRDEPTE